MLIDSLEYTPPLLPLEGFSLSGKLPYNKRILLPDFSEMLNQEKFADVSISWNEKGLFITVDVNVACGEVSYPSFEEGDAFELFLDTRDNKTSRFLNAFCHRFVFLPKAVQGMNAQEITVFRGEQTHPLASSQFLHCKTEHKRSSYEMKIHIESAALHGFDPLGFPKIGIAYRMHRYKASPQQFSVGNAHFSLEQQPQFWASFSFVTKKERTP